jgi:hypothetical protein
MPALFHTPHALARHHAPSIIHALHALFIFLGYPSLGMLPFSWSINYCLWFLTFPVLTPLHISLPLIFFYICYALMQTNPSGLAEMKCQLIFMSPTRKRRIFLELPLGPFGLSLIEWKFTTSSSCMNAGLSCICSGAGPRSFLFTSNLSYFEPSTINNEGLIFPCVATQDVG